MELPPPPPGISEAAAAPRGALTPAPIPSEDAAPASAASASGVPRCAVPRGVWSRPPPREASAKGLGRCPTGFHWQPLRNGQKRSLPGSGVAATKWCLSGPERSGEMGKGQVLGWSARSERVLGSHGRAAWLAGARTGKPGRLAAGASALTLTPTRAHSQLLLPPLLLQRLEGGW